MVLEISAAAPAVDVLVSVEGTKAGATVDPTGDTVEMAFVASGTPTEPDWRAASWETAGSAYYAKCLVGSSGTGALTAGTIYAVWLRIADNPETVVVRVGYVKLY